MKKSEQNKRTLGVLVLLIILSSSAYAGDIPWLMFQDSGGGNWGVGEISDHLLIYLGHEHWITPIPTTKASGLMCLTIFTATAVAVITTFIKPLKEQIK